MKYHMDTYSLISVANYLGFLEGTGRIEIAEEDQLYGIMEQIDEDVNKACESTLDSGFDFWTEVDHSLRRQGVLKNAK